MARRVDLEIRDGTILFRLDAPDATALDLSGYLLLPGLINAHDHLEFNLFPRLGTRIYSNSTEWASDIHRPGDSPIREHLSIRMPVRLTWGGIKNLLSGVTTVVHHGPYESSLFEGGFPVRVVRDFDWADSLTFTPDLAKRFRRAPSRWPFILHAAEGTDAQAKGEIRLLENLGILAEHTVLVHAIGMGGDDLELIRGRRASIVWCPRSNLATYGRTLSRETLRSGIPIALGTDSALSTASDLIDELRTAKREGGITAEEVYRMVTSQAAQVLRLTRGEGRIREGGVANLVAVVDEGQSPAEAILDLRPEFVMMAGRFKLLSERIASAPLRAHADQLHAIDLAPRGKYFVNADIPFLYEAAADKIGPEVRLAGRLVTSGAISEPTGTRL